jgi:hypothetical protein
VRWYRLACGTPLVQVSTLALAGSLALALAACSAPAGPAATANHAAPASSPAAAPAAARTWPPDPQTMAALLRIAQVFNTDYDSGRYGAVYDRWDARSQAIISRAEYIQRHLECPTAPTGAPVRVESATRGRAGRWLVRYEVEGSQAVDTWFYQAHRWVFDIILSNPGAAAQYRMPFRQYETAVGCHPQ